MVKCNLNISHKSQYSSVPITNHDDNYTAISSQLIFNLYIAGYYMFKTASSTHLTCKNLIIMKLSVSNDFISQKLQNITSKRRTHSGARRASSGHGDSYAFICQYSPFFFSMHMYSSSRAFTGSHLPLNTVQQCENVYVQDSVKCSMSIVQFASNTVLKNPKHTC